MAIYLVRHGQAITGTDDLDPGLAEIGHEQARLTADHFEELGSIGRILVSPLRRTRDTAAPIAERLGIEPEVRSEIAEVFDPSMPAEERRNMIGPFMEGHWSKQNETLKNWRRRVVDTLMELGLAAGESNTGIVVVSHYIAIGVAIGEATGNDLVVPLPIANTSITTIEAGHGGLRLVAAAETHHLPAELIGGHGQAMAGGGQGQ